MIRHIPSMLGLGPDRRIAVPDDLRAITMIGPESDPAHAGLDHAAVESIWSAVCEWYAAGVNPAIQICLRRDGAVILNRAIGHEPENAKPATPDTPMCIYSASKGITATVVHMLAERGALALNDRVCQYLPAFAAHSKHHITIQQLLDYSAGIPEMPRDVPLAALIDTDDRMRSILQSLRPLHRPGLLHIYHPLTGGLVLREVVRAATDRCISDVLAEEILRPLGFRWTNYGVAPHDLALVGRCAMAGRTAPAPVTSIMRRGLSGSLDDIVELANQDSFLTAVLPPANVVSTAAELARFYEILLRGGELDGVRVLNPESVRQAVAPRGRLAGVPGLRISSGFVLGQHISLFGRNTESLFGHPGLTSVFAWADPARGLSGAVVPNGKSLLAGNIHLTRLLDRIACRIPQLTSPPHFTGVSGRAA
ncbi:MAG: pbpE [Nocardia sp.]|uniref:serine hydrolase domain-containing protein n=1 Tax=Nocardia sp. TaxID=1821 RepID=UPI002631508B|nr:serine hydrolase domain-containing protein [Nocardia sp.]MCU1643010.1 pbpE [Nocardia sp.]